MSSLGLSEQTINLWAPAIAPLAVIPPEHTNLPQSSFHEYRRLIVHEFLAKRFNSKLRAKRLKPEARKWIHAEVDVLDRAFDLIQEVAVMDPAALGKRTVPMWWSVIVAEYEIWGDLPLQKETKNQYLTRYRNITSQLQGRNSDPKNPFQGESTKHLFDRILKLADEHDRFRKNRLTPFIKARQSMATVISTQGKIFEEKGGKMRQQRQGRKKAISETQSQRGIQKKRSSN